MKRVVPTAFAATAALLTAISMSACAPSLGTTIEASPVPVPAVQSSARARFGTVVSITDIRDSRPAPVGDGIDKYTEPHGGIPQILENALKDTLSGAGIAVVGSAPIEMKIDLTKWRSKIEPKASVMLSSEATISVELVDPSGKRVFTGTYNGVRTSQFPVVTRVDVKDSLGLAMSNALEQLVSDPQFLQLIGSF